MKYFTIIIFSLCCQILTSQQNLDLIETELYTSVTPELVDVDFNNINTNYTMVIKTSCHCAISLDTGPQPKNINPIKNFGVIKTYSGLKPNNKKNRRDCGHFCAKMASTYINKITPTALCNYAKKPNPNVIAYSKLGSHPTRKWEARGANLFPGVTCCNIRNVECPAGTWSEDGNFPGMCTKYHCDVPGDRRLYDDKGNPWGYIYKGKLHSLIPGKVTNSGWKSCK